MLYKYGRRMHNFFSLVFYILGAFLIKQLFHSPLLDTCMGQILCVVPSWISTISYPMCARGIIVKNSTILTKHDNFLYCMLGKLCTIITMPALDFF